MNKLTKKTYLGEKRIKFNDLEVIFDVNSTIRFGKGEELLLQLDPTELSTLYWAYMGMREELGE